MLSPKVLARWRTFLPEETVEAILQHREKVIEMRRVEERIRVPDFAYYMPRLRPIEEKPEVFAMGIDTDGWISTRVSRTKRHKVYTYHVEEPRVGFATDSLEVTNKMADMLLAGITPYRQRPAKPPMFGVLVGTSRAVRAVYLALPYLIKRENVSKANKILRLYRERPSIPIA